MQGSACIKAKAKSKKADAVGPRAQDLFLQMCQASEHDTPLLRLLRLQQAAAPAAGGVVRRPVLPCGAPERQLCAGRRSESVRPARSVACASRCLMTLAHVR